jgi:hypothetical protein
MTQAHPKKKFGHVVFAIIVIVFLIGAYTYGTEPTTDRSVVQDMDSLVYGIQALGQGDAQGFAVGLTNSLPIIGLIIVVFIIYYFLFTTIFASFFSKKISTVLSVVLLLFTLSSRQAYNQLLSLNVFVISFLVFSALVIMLWGFTSDTGKQTLEEIKGGDPHKEQRELTKKQIKELREYLEKEAQRSS